MACESRDLFHIRPLRVECEVQAGIWRAYAINDGPRAASDAFLTRIEKSWAGARWPSLCFATTSEQTHFEVIGVNY